MNVKIVPMEKCSIQAVIGHFFDGAVLVSLFGSGNQGVHARQKHLKSLASNQHDSFFFEACFVAALSSSFHLKLIVGVSKNLLERPERVKVLLRFHVNRSNDFQSWGNPRLSNGALHCAGAFPVSLRRLHEMSATRHYLQRAC